MKKINWWLVEYSVATILSVLCALTWLSLYHEDNSQWVVWAFLTICFFLGRLELKIGKTS
jgi:hypothetical protein